MTCKVESSLLSEFFSNSSINDWLSFSLDSLINASALSAKPVLRFGVFFSTFSTSWSAFLLLPKSIASKKQEN